MFVVKEKKSIISIAAEILAIFCRYTAINLYTFFLVFLKFLLILIFNKLDNSYIFPLAKTVMHRLELSIMFATLGQLAAVILVIL